MRLAAIGVFIIFASLLPVAGVFARAVPVGGVYCLNGKVAHDLQATPEGRAVLEHFLAEAALDLPRMLQGYAPDSYLLSQTLPGAPASYPYDILGSTILGFIPYQTSFLHLIKEVSQIDNEVTVSDDAALNGYFTGNIHLTESFIILNGKIEMEITFGTPLSSFKFPKSARLCTDRWSNDN